MLCDCRNILSINNTVKILLFNVFFKCCSGTQNILNACVSNCVTSLVYTSTQDVILGPDYFVNGDESLPYPTDFRYGEYGRTKCEAKKMVLKVDKSTLKDGTVRNAV